MPIEPLVPHDDLIVEHFIVGENGDMELPRPTPCYVTRLHQPGEEGVRGAVDVAEIIFHKGSPEKGWHGWTTAKVIEALIQHMEYHQSTPFACEQNKEILSHLQAAHKATEKRRDDRKDRGVLYDTEKP